MTKRQEKLADQRIENMYRLRCAGFQISVLAIADVFAVGYAAVERGAGDKELGDDLFEFVQTIAK